MTEWKTYRLGEIVSTNKKSIGRSYPFSMIKYLDTGSITRNHIESLQEYKLSEAPSRAKRLVQEDDIIYSAVRPNQLHYGYISKFPENLVVSTGFIVISCNKNYIEPKFLYYMLTQQEMTDYLHSIADASTSAYPSLKSSDIENLEISLPPLEEQRRIAGILGAIDDKIENNRRINTNLELQAQALYKQWFVDNRSDDWEERPLSEIIFFQEGPGIRNWQYVEKKGVRFINIRCINDGDVNVQNANMISENEACGKYAHFLLKPLDIVMSCSGTLGRYAIIRQEHLPLCLNTSVIRFRPAKCIEDYSFVYGYLSSTEFLNKQEEMACGSVQANFGPTHLKQIKIQVPPKDYRTKYNNVVMPIITAMLKNRTEMNMLSSLRDTLLPKLMNGELKIGE